MNTLNLDFLRHSIEQMTEKGILFDKGLSAEEIAIAENRYGVHFPYDLRAFLVLALPLPHEIPEGLEKTFPDNYLGARKFPNWRGQEDIDEQHIRYMLEWPVTAILLDIEAEAKDDWYWFPEWGEMPENLDERKQKAANFIRQAPRLIPIFVHRFIPESPYEAGNPVFSMHGMDTIIYGMDLADYLANEFRFDKPDGVATKPKHIEFWCKLAQCDFYQSQ